MKKHTCILAAVLASVAFGPCARAEPLNHLKPSPLVSAADELVFVPLDASDTKHLGVMVHVIFGNLSQKGPVAFLARLPAGYSAGPHSHRSDSYLTTIKGNYYEWRPGQPEGKVGGVGGTVFVPANVMHNNRCDAQAGSCLNYAYFPEGFSVVKP
ncbi:MAG: hypothetical protein WCI65_09390 [Synechococcaceae cyanobacterium ELA263]